MANSPPAVLMRRPADAYPRLVVRERSDAPIDLALARRQHQAVADAFRGLGLEVEVLPAIEELPDSVFIEDTALVVGELAILCPFSEPRRAGEEERLEPVLRRSKRVERVEPPATIDGGDCILAGERLLVGLSGRTDERAVERLGELLPELEVIPIDIRASGLLHLKSAASYLGDDTLLIDPTQLDRARLEGLGYRVLETPPGEGFAANCVAVGGTVLLADGFPGTRRLVEARQRDTLALDVSEFRKGDGALTCLSLLL
jgi:dimethylargininase